MNNSEPVIDDESVIEYVYSYEERLLEEREIVELKRKVIIDAGGTPNE